MANSSSSKEGVASNAGSAKAPESDRDWNENENPVLDSSRNSGAPSLESVKEEQV